MTSLHPMYMYGVPPNEKAEKLAKSQVMGKFASSMGAGPGPR